MSESSSEFVRYRLALEGEIAVNEVPRLIEAVSQFAVLDSVSLTIDDATAEKPPEFNEKYVTDILCIDGKTHAVVTPQHLKMYERQYEESPNGFSTRIYRILFRHMADSHRDQYFAIDEHNATVGLYADKISTLIAEIKTPQGKNRLNLSSWGFGSESLKFLERFDRVLRSPTVRA